MGNGINKVDEGLFICSVKGLRPRSRLRDLGIRCVLNAAQAELYQQGLAKEESLKDLHDEFDVLVLNLEDCESCRIREHFSRIADFIEAGRAKGGVVVHCAAGVSRASTSVLCYLLIKEHWQLEAAFRWLHAVRPCVEPNAGFWRQLRELEASLRQQGIELRPLPADWSPPKQPFPENEEEREILTGEGLSADAKIAKLDEEATKRAPFFATACLVPAEGTSAKDLATFIAGTRWLGVSWESVVSTGAEVNVRAGLAAPIDCDIFRSLLYKAPGVQAATVEPARF